jgi:hypothetical protein
MLIIGTVCFVAGGAITYLLMETGEDETGISNITFLISIIGLFLAIAGVVLMPSRTCTITYKDDNGQMVTVEKVHNVKIQDEYVSYESDKIKYIIKSDFVEVKDSKED